MSYVTVVYSTVAACALLLALIHGLIWVMDRKAHASLAFAWLALAIVGGVVMELGTMRADSAQAWGEWVRWTQIPVFMRITATVVFIRLYLGTGRAWLMWTIIALRSFIVIANFVFDPNFHFTAIESIEQRSFLGEQVTVLGHGIARDWQWLATFANLLLLTYVADATLQLLRAGSAESRRKALVVGGATLVSALMSMLYSQLMILAGLQVPALLSPPQLIMFSAMAFELSRGTLRASRLARELEGSQSRLDVVTAAAGLGLWTWDARAGSLWANSRARAMFGLESSGDDFLVVDTVRRLIHPDDLGRIREIWRHAAAAGTEEEVQFRILLPGAVTRWIIAHGRSEADAAGNLTRVQGVLRDVTDQWRARLENEELRRELAHAGRVSVLGTLSSSLAHELSQPLGAIMLNAEAAELLLNKPQTDLEELRNIIADVQRDGRRAAEVIDGLRKLLKRRELEFTPVAIDSLLRDVMALLKSDAISRSVLLECAIDPELPSIRGDKVHLSQVLINLVINGMDAVSGMPAAQRRVILDARMNVDQAVELSVTDLGHGIPEEVRGRIFEPFFTTKSQGMGMGLAVSQTIVQAHGGKIWADSPVSGGAIFRVSLPVGAAA